MKDSRPVHILYVLDISPSMLEHDKLEHAKRALKKALCELKPDDTYNLICFGGTVYSLWNFMAPADNDYIEAALSFVDRLGTSPGKDLVAALRAALSVPGVGCIYLISDVQAPPLLWDLEQLVASVCRWNTKDARINTLGIGAGEAFCGAELLKEIAGANQGLYGYVDVTKLEPLQAQTLS